MNRSRLGIPGHRRLLRVTTNARRKPGETLASLASLSKIQAELAKFFVLQESTI